MNPQRGWPTVAASLPSLPFPLLRGGYEGHGVDEGHELWTLPVALPVRSQGLQPLAQPLPVPLALPFAISTSPFGLALPLPLPCLAKGFALAFVFPFSFASISKYKGNAKEIRRAKRAGKSFGGICWKCKGDTKALEAED